ncbi:hypothetical protein [Natronosalvus rutilus]|uniref:Uncharacterized protein n=1 Tax=Natronosalvus rutilus TaxID=2953753 RepID=A0A9E7NC89_9EURY|nr:hypothetical protein [Natronosalvus rutilus]UTF55799.1 hypothetical protein NGM29_19175 [Natronosalvus rutilus]
MTGTPSRHRVVATIALLGLVVGSGCLTLSPTVTIETTESTVFEQLSVTEPWASKSVETTVTLTPAATTTNGVTQLVVIAESGSTFDSTTIDSGQTSVTMYLPTNQNATIVAVNAVNGTVVERRTVATDGNKLF